MKYTLKLLPSLVFSLIILNANACPLCNTEIGVAVQKGILENHFWLMLSSIMIIFLIFIGVVIYLSHFLADKIDHKEHHISKKFLVASMLFGGGVIGFLDGIFFHQIFQLHGMLANKLPLDSLVNVEINMFWDGIFHLLTLLLILASFALFWRSVNYSTVYKSNTFLFGLILLGAGIFNFIEGIINHTLLELHHVLQQASRSFIRYGDVIFLVVSIALIGFGAFYIGKGIPQEPIENK